MRKEEKQRPIVEALQDSNEYLSIGEELIAPIKHVIDYTSGQRK